MHQKCTNICLRAYPHMYICIHICIDMYAFIHMCVFITMLCILKVGNICISGLEDKEPYEGSVVGTFESAPVEVWVRVGEEG